MPLNLPQSAFDSLNLDEPACLMHLFHLWLLLLDSGQSLIATLLHETVQFDLDLLTNVCVAT